MIAESGTRPTEKGIPAVVLSRILMSMWSSGPLREETDCPDPEIALAAGCSGRDTALSARVNTHYKLKPFKTNTNMITPMNTGNMGMETQLIQLETKHRPALV